MSPSPSPRSFIINIRNGLFTEKHRSQMGSAIWEFGLLLDWVTKEEIDHEGICWGKVHGGTPIKVQNMASLLGEHINTCFRNLALLENFGYIRRRRAPYGFIIEIKNSWKFRERESQGTVTLLLGDSQKTVSPDSPNTVSLSPESQDIVSPDSLNVGRESQHVVSVIKTEHDRTCTTKKKDKSTEHPVDVSFDADMEEIRAFYCEHIKKIRVFDDVRKRMLRARLKVWSKEELKEVILNIKESAYNMGDNDDEKEYNSFDLLFRNDRKVEQYLNLKKKNWTVPPDKPRRIPQ